MIMSNCYITMVDITDAKHRSKIIIQKIPLNYFGEFNNLKQLEKLAAILGFSYELQETKTTQGNGKMEIYSVSHRIIDAWDSNFWNIDALPKNAKPFKALSNGSIVTCYFTNNGETISIYRPNPNAKTVYDKMSHTEQIAFRNENGTY